ncbi:uncharacterized protein [Periplaneta americana]|uniref:uncharacterized protein n=1 Tax=Periplaneta americana TaxID=6978 RepID=UPI0037E9C45C
MPEVKLVEVRGYTSQDEKHPADNLLTGNLSGGKWLTSSSKTVTSMSATFQLAECCVISSVHIGNHGSAFVSLLVSKLGCTDFKDLLPCSALMTMQESRMGQNKMCVKIYSKDDFLEETRDGKWDLLRVVVTQPFNLHTQFGLSFMRLFSYVEEETASNNINIDFLSKWQKMKKEVTNSSPTSVKLTGQRSGGSSPLSRSEKLRRQTDEKAGRFQDVSASSTKNEDIDESLLEASTLSFMESLKLQDEDLDRIQLIDVREKMEHMQGRKFSTKERHIFSDIVKKYVMSLKSSENTNRSSSPSVRKANINVKEVVTPKLNMNSVSKENTNKANSPNVMKADTIVKEPVAPRSNINLVSKENANKTNSPNIKKENTILKEPVTPKSNTNLVNKLSQNHSANKRENSMKESNVDDGLTGWLNTTRNLSLETNTSKSDGVVMPSPSTRRNRVSLADSGHKLEDRSPFRSMRKEAISEKTNELEKTECATLEDLSSPLKRKVSSENDNNKKLCVADSDMSDIRDISRNQDHAVIDSVSKQAPDQLVECPICKVYFEADVIENHSSECTAFAGSDVPNITAVEEVSCPMCSVMISPAIADIHANMCATKMFGD